MRVCLLTRYFDPYRKEGVGIGRVSGGILQGLTKRGISVHRISTEGSGLYSYFWYTLVQTKAEIRNGFDVYHALTPLEGIWIPKDRGVVTFHDLFQITHPGRLGGGMGYNSLKHFIGTRYFKLACWIASRAKIIVCVSRRTREAVIKYLGVPEYKIRIIRSGINSDLRPRKKTDNVFRVGYLGMLDRRKRVDVLIKAFKESIIDGELLIGGSGLDESKLKALAGTDTRIKFLGPVKERNLCDFYNSLNLFVFPTWLEGYGLPIVEAMACKKPVIVLADAVIPEELKLRCIESTDLTVTLKRAKEIPDRVSPDFTEDNYKFAKEHDWDKCVDEYIKVYEEVVNG